MTTTLRHPNTLADTDGVALFMGGEGGYHTYRIPAVIRAQNGSLLAFCEGRISGIKIPKDVAFIDQIPRNANGKFLKREIRAKLAGK